jgi:hypothetical protein
MNIVACGALANELIALKKLNGWEHIKLSCLPAHYHQTPQKIPAAVRAAIENIRLHNDEPVLVAYGDCGTGGKLDEVLAETGAKRLPGAHCYQFFAGQDAFLEMHEAEIGTFYLTDFLVRHFDTYVYKALGLDRKPELLEMYFGNYTRLMYLAQTKSETLVKLARAHAVTLGLEYAYQYTDYGELGSTLSNAMNVNVNVNVAVPCPT